MDLVTQGPVFRSHRSRLAPVQRVEVTGPRLIGLAGRARSGKSTAAEVLETVGYVRLSFAGPFKAMLRALLSARGVASAEVERMLAGDLKGVPSPALDGRTPREAMQTLGTEWGRVCMGWDFWVNSAMAKAEAILAAGGLVVLDDVRFLNEAAAICGPEIDHARGLREVWRVDGRGGIAGGHASEAEISRIQPDLVLDNSGTVEALERQILEAVLG